MDNTLYIVRYTGPFGFIKPWTAVQDGETYSQQFLTPSIVEGMEKKLFPELLSIVGIQKIRRHRLSYSGLSVQMEQTQTRGWNKDKKHRKRPRSILYRGVLVEPVLHLAFTDQQDAEIATKQHLCLCRNEDVVLPEPVIIRTQVDDFDEEQFAGFELVFEENEQSFLVGFNRLDNAKPMYGWLKTVGNPVKTFS